MTRSTSRGDKSILLLEVGLSWPLDTYVVAKLEGLAARGLRVVAAIASTPGEAAAPLRGVEVLDQPWWDEPPLAMVLGLARDFARLAFRSPRSLGAAGRAARRPIKKASRARPLAFARRLRAYLRLAALRPDVVHFEWNSAAIKYQPMAAVWRCPTVVSCHGSEVSVRPHLPGGAAFAAALAESFAGVTAVHCVSESVAADATALGMDPGRARVIPPGVDVARFRPGAGGRRGTTAGRRPLLRVISVGQLRWLKGHEYSLRAIRRLRTEHVPVTLELIGGDPAASLAEESDRDRLEKLIDGLGLTDCVKLRGRVTHDEVRLALQDADVLLHLPVSEGFGVAVLEAMASGLPVVVSDAGGLPEAVTDGGDGFVVPACDPTAAAAALRRLYEDPALRERMGAAGRRVAVERFTLDRQLKVTVAFYASLKWGLV